MSTIGSKLWSEVRKQNAPQSQEIPGHLEIDDLPRPVGLELVGTDPTRGQDIGGLSRLALMHHIAPRDEGPAALVQPFKHGQFDLRQGDEGRELAGQRAVFC